MRGEFIEHLELKCVIVVRHSSDGDAIALANLMDRERRYLTCTFVPDRD
jgi:hypothetical protein